MYGQCVYYSVSYRLCSFAENIAETIIGSGVKSQPRPRPAEKTLTFFMTRVFFQKPPMHGFAVKLCGNNPEKNVL